MTQKYSTNGIILNKLNQYEKLSHIDKFTFPDILETVKNTYLQFKTYCVNLKCAVKRQIYFLIMNKLACQYLQLYQVSVTRSLHNIHILKLLIFY